MYYVSYTFHARAIFDIEYMWYIVEVFTRVIYSLCIYSIYGSALVYHRRLPLEWCQVFSQSCTRKPLSHIVNFLITVDIFDGFKEIMMIIYIWHQLTGMHTSNEKYAMTVTVHFLAEALRYFCSIALFLLIIWNIQY